MGPSKKRHHRDSAGEIALPIGGQILHVVTMRDAIWFFKKDGAYRTVLPDQIDPARQTDGLPVQNTWDTTMAASNVLVARMLLQPADMLRQIFTSAEDDPFDLKELLFDITRSLLKGREIGNRLGEQIRKAKIVAATKTPRSFPTVEIHSEGALQGDVDAALGYFKRVAQVALNIPHYLLGTTHRGQMAHTKAKAEMEARYGASDPIVETFNEFNADIERLREVRNAIEHPKPGFRVRVSDWMLGADGKPTPPTIHHEQNGTTATYPVADFLSNTFGAVFNFTEELFLACVDKQEAGGGFKYHIAEIDPIDPACPIQYLCRLGWRDGKGPAPAP